MSKYLYDQLYHANWIIFFLIVGFSFMLGKMNMRKELDKIHTQIVQAERNIMRELGKRK
jgi:membrane-bound acyltransferase YfiQ involved in biofilm formation